METKSTGGIIGIIVVIIVILVGGIFFWGSRISPAREKAAMEKMKAEEAMTQTNEADEVSAEIEALGNVDVSTDLPDLQ